MSIKDLVAWAYDPECACVNSDFIEEVSRNYPYIVYRDMETKSIIKMIDNGSYDENSIFDDVEKKFVSYKIDNDGVETKVLTQKKAPLKKLINNGSFTVILPNGSRETFHKLSPYWLDIDPIW
jgi:hypothetical protein